MTRKIQSCDDPGKSFQVKVAAKTLRQEVALQIWSAVRGGEIRASGASYALGRRGDLILSAVDAIGECEAGRSLWFLCVM